MRGLAAGLGFLLAFLLAVPADAGVLEGIAAAGVLRVGTTGDYPPYTRWAAGEAEPSGIDIDMAQALGRSLGVRVVFVRTRWADLATDLQAQRFDIAMGGISVTPERAATARFSLAYQQDGKTPVARCADPAAYASLAEIDRPEIRVIVNPGGTNERFVAEHLQRATILHHPDNLTIFDRLLAGDADLMITDASEARYVQKRRPGLCARHPDQPFDHFAKAYLLPRDDAFAARVDAWLAAALAGPDYRRILAAWLD